MKKHFVNYEIAFKLKELGFNEECFGYYTKDKFLCIFQEEDYFLSNETPNIYIVAPIYQQVIDFFRNKYSFHVYVSMTDKAWRNIINKHIEETPQLERTINDFKYSFNIIDNNDDAYFGHYPSYEEAREQSILKAIELCKK